MRAGSCRPGDIHSGTPFAFLLRLLVQSAEPLVLTVGAPSAAEFAETHRFYSYANWLVPGELMVGRYPFLEANRCKWVPAAIVPRQGSAQRPPRARTGWRLIAYPCVQDPHPGRGPAEVHPADRDHRVLQPAGALPSSGCGRGIWGRSAMPAAAPSPMLRHSVMPHRCLPQPPPGAPYREIFSIKKYCQLW